MQRVSGEKAPVSKALDHCRLLSIFADSEKARENLEVYSVQPAGDI